MESPGVLDFLRVMVDVPQQYELLKTLFQGLITNPVAAIPLYGYMAFSSFTHMFIYAGHYKQNILGRLRRRHRVMIGDKQYPDGFKEERYSKFGQFRIPEENQDTFNPLDHIPDNDEFKDSENLQLEELVKKQLIHNGYLKVSSLWYHTSDQVRMFVEKTFSDKKDLETNSGKEANSLQKIIKDLSFQELLKHNCVDMIDIGCGNGQPAVELLKHFCEEVCYVPVDVSPLMTTIAKENITHNFNTCNVRPKNKLFSNPLSYRTDGSFSLGSKIMNPLFMKYSIFRKKMKLKRMVRRLKKLADNKRWNSYLEHIGGNSNIESKLQELKDYVSRGETGIEYLGEVSKKVKSMDKKELLQLHFNLTGRNYSALVEFKNFGFDLLKLLPIYYTAKTTQFAFLFGPAIVQDYLFGKIFNYRLASHDPNFCPYWFDNAAMPDDFSSQIYNLNQSLKCRTWLPEEDTDTLLGNLLGELDDVSKVERVREGERDKVYVMPSVNTDFTQKGLDKSILDLTYGYYLYNNQRIYLFLGNTLGNFTPTERRSLSEKLYKTMSPGDMLVVGVQLAPDDNDPNLDDKIKDIKEDYVSFGREFLKPLIKGFEDKVEFKADYVDSCVEMYYEVICSFTVENGKSRTFDVGDKIPVASSRKFISNEIKTTLENEGFKEIGRDITIGRSGDSDFPEYEVMVVKK